MGGQSGTDSSQLVRHGRSAWALVGFGLVGWGALRVLAELRVVVVPFILAALLAAAAMPLVDRLERIRVRRSIGSGLVVLGGVGVLLGGFAWILPQLAEQLATLAAKAQIGLSESLRWLEGRLPAGALPDLEGGFAQLLGDQLGGQGDGLALAGTLLPVVGRVGELAAMLALTIVFWFFLLRDGRTIAAAMPALVPHRVRARAAAAGREGWQMLSQFIKGTFIIAAVDAAGIGVGLVLLDVPAAAALTALVFLGGFVPVVGASVSGLLAALVALASGGPTTALAVVGIVVVVQQVEGNVLQPLVMRRMVRLHPMVVLAALTAGASSLGILGAFLAVPAAAAAAAGARAVLAERAAELRAESGERREEPMFGPKGPPHGRGASEPESGQGQFRERV